MNKLVKGSIAGAAGIALLLGGAGTLALWNADADITVDNIESGILTLEAGNVVAGTAPTLWVPGDSVTYAADLTIGATGDNLTATLSVDSGSVFLGDLADELDINLAVNLAGVTGVTANGNGTFDVTSAANGEVLPVVVTVSLPQGSENISQDGDADLSELAFLLQQYR